jgi:PTH1 family peptidyl-tRNA hydrolase
MAQAAFDLVVGLGNPGPRYDRTRHNAGFWFVDAVAARWGGAFREEGRHRAELARVRVDDLDLRLMKPQTFMNRSGQAVCPYVAYFRIPVERVLVVHDDIDLPPGTVRLKRGGGHGGHNGLRSLVSCMDKGFWRLRLGVGHPGHRDAVVDYVLSTPRPEEREAIEEAMARALSVFPELLRGRASKVMQELHTKATS